MAITTYSGLKLAEKDRNVYFKSAGVTAIVGKHFTSRGAAGLPAAAALAAGNTTTGVVPTSATTWSLTFPAPLGGQSLYFLGVESRCLNLQPLEWVDMLWYAGAVSSVTLATTSFSGQPSFAARLPGGNDFKGVELWLEVTTAMTTTVPIVTISYTNQDGTAGRTVSAFSLDTALANLIVGRWIPVPLAAGDEGVQSVQSVQVTTGSAAGAFNVVLARSIFRHQSKVGSNTYNVDGLDKTTFKEISSNACIIPIGLQQATNTNIISATVITAEG